MSTNWNNHMIGIGVAAISKPLVPDSLTTFVLYLHILYTYYINVFQSGHIHHGNQCYRCSSYWKCHLQKHMTSPDIMLQQLSSAS